MMICNENKNYFAVVICIALVLFLGCKSDNITSNDDLESNLSIAIVSGNNKIGIVNSMLDFDFIVRVTDESDNPIKDISVTFEITVGDGTLENSTSTTNSIGIAKTRLSFGSQEGKYDIKAELYNGELVSFGSFAVHPVELITYSKGINYIEMLWSHKIADGFEDYTVYRRDSHLYGDSLLVQESSDSTFTDLNFDIEKEYVYTIYANYPEYGSIKTSNYKTKGNLQVDFLSNPFDLAFDSTRQLVYVSLPDENCIAIISTNTWELLEKINVGVLPHGIDINFDFSKLYVALFTGGEVVSLDLDNYSLKSFAVGSALGSDLTYDVCEAMPNRVFVSAHLNSFRDAYLAVIKADLWNFGRRVPDRTQSQWSKNLFNDRPIFPTNPNDSLLYVVEQGHYGIIDLKDTNYTLVKRGARGSLHQFNESPDGSRLYMWNGDVIATDSMTQIIHLNKSGLPLINQSGDILYIGRTVGHLSPIGSVTSYDAQTFLPIDSMLIDFKFTRMEMMPGDSIILFLMDNGIQGIDIRNIN